MDKTRIFSTNLFNLFVLTCFGFLSVVSSDTDYHAHSPHHHHNFQHHKQDSSSSGPGRLDSLWKDVVEAAFASPMEWIQLSRALDKITAEEEELPLPGWKQLENSGEPIHLAAGNSAGEQQLQLPSQSQSHPDRQFTYHKVYQNKSTSGESKSKPAKANKIKQSAAVAVAIAAMSVSHETQPQLLRSLHENVNENENNNNHPQEIQQQRSSSPRTSLEREVIESLAKHKNAIELGEDFHWRPWISHSSVHQQNSDAWRSLNLGEVKKHHEHRHLNRNRKKHYDQLPLP